MTEKLANDAAGEPVSPKEKILTTGASLAQDFGPVKQICAHLNAFHAYAAEPSRCVEANHYCSHVNDEVRQCIIYDSPGPNARLIGIEYMITPRLYKSLPEDERRLWHSHVFEVKSGMLIMPNSSMVPEAAWEQAETKEMEDVVGLYGKTYHFWQVDRGDKLPLGPPQLMVSFTEPSQLDSKQLQDRDQRFGVNHEHKAELRKDIHEPEIHDDADNTWKSSSE